MSWSKRTVIRILLLVARMVCDESELTIEIKHLANHIDVWAPKASS